MKYRITIDFECEEDFPEVDATGQPEIDEIFETLPNAICDDTTRVQLKKIADISN